MARHFKWGIFVFSKVHVVRNSPVDLMNEALILIYYFKISEKSMYINYLKIL